MNTGDNSTLRRKCDDIRFAPSGVSHAEAGTILRDRVNLLDRRRLIDHLEKAEWHVAQGAEHVARQRMLVEQLDCQARTQARELLSQFEEMQQVHIADRDRLRAKLAAME